MAVFGYARVSTDLAAASFYASTRSRFSNAVYWTPAGL
jgi:hypothetical protein